MDLAEANLASFFASLRETGSAQLVVPPHSPGKFMEMIGELERQAANEGRLLTMLQEWHELATIEAGEPIFDADAAWWGARVFFRCAFFFLERGSSASNIGPALVEPIPRAQTAAAHFSADLTLGWLPDLYSQAKAVAPGDPLIEHFQRLARLAPLSGIGIPWKLAESGTDETIFFPSCLTGTPGIWQLVIDRVIQRRDRQKLANPFVAESVRASLGAFAHELADNLLDIPAAAA